jgi:teichuronic acid biosynthesis glycosyltransferase TuaG
MVLVSVLMNSYNHEKYISEAIDSVLNQTFKDFELVIIDDCSKDNSSKIIKNYQRKDERIRAFFHKKNMGIAKTSNHCLAEAKGKFIAFIDSDDVWVASKLEKQLAILKNNASVIVWSEGEIINKKGIPSGKTFTQRHFASSKKKSGNIFEELLDHNFIFGSSLMFKKEYVKDIHYDEQLKYLNDYKFAVNLAKKHPFFFIKEPLAKYRIHGKNTILLDKENWFKDTVLVKKYFLREYGNQISKRKKADLLFRIAREYSSLSRDSRANFFPLEADSLIPFFWINLLFLICFLTKGKSYFGELLVNSFATVDSSLIELRSKLKI